MSDLQGECTRVVTAVPMLPLLPGLTALTAPSVAAPFAETLKELALRNAMESLDQETADRICMERLEAQILLDMVHRNEPYVLTIKSGSVKVDVPLKVSSFDKSREVEFQMDDELIAEPEGLLYQSITEMQPVTATFNFANTVELRLDDIEVNLVYPIVLNSGKRHISNSTTFPAKIVEFEQQSLTDHWNVTLMVVIDMSVHKQDVDYMAMPHNDAEHEGNRLRGETGQIVDVQLMFERSQVRQRLP